jgi:uncharacterized protein (DUF2267 family)
MQYEEFIQRVQERADLGSREEAVRATEAVLGTLGERLYRTERDDVAAQLPKELERCLLKYVNAATTRRQVDRFGVENFYIRVRGRADLTFPEAVKQSRAAVAILREAISAGEWQDMRSSLPEEYADLFGGEPPKPPLP